MAWVRHGGYKIVTCRSMIITHIDTAAAEALSGGSVVYEYFEAGVEAIWHLAYG